jgi:hypothetical protein
MLHLNHIGFDAHGFVDAFTASVHSRGKIPCESHQFFVVDVRKYTRSTLSFFPQFFGIFPLELLIATDS